MPNTNEDGVIKQQVNIPVTVLQDVFPEVPIKEDTDVYLIRTTDGFLIEFEHTQDGGGLAILGVDLVDGRGENAGTYTLLRRGDIAPIVASTMS